MAKKPTTPRRPAAKPTILTVEHFDAVDAALQRLGTLLPVIEDAELCDVDCQEYRRAHAFYIDKFQKIKQKFFPNGRPK